MTTIDDLRIKWNNATGRKIQFDYAFCINSTITRTHIKNFLLDSGYIEYQCIVCNINEWHGNKLSLELDHINGINNDNRIENLRLLCPNCHSLTNTFSKKRCVDNVVRKNDDALIDAIRSTSNIRQALLKVGLQPFGGNYDRVRKIKRTNDIKQADLYITSRKPPMDELIINLLKYGLCNDIASHYGVDIKTIRKWLFGYGLPSTRKAINKYLLIKFPTHATNLPSRKSMIPSKEDLLVELTKNPIITTVAKHFTVSDNTIRQWMKKYNIPVKMNELKKYLGESYNRKIAANPTPQRGMLCKTSKLTDNDVTDIRELYATGNYSHRSLASKFNVTNRTICSILRNETWKHIPIK